MTFENYVVCIVCAFWGFASIALDFLSHKKLHKRVEQLEDEIKSLKIVNGFLFCSFMEHVKSSVTLRGDKDDTNIS